MIRLIQLIKQNSNWEEILKNKHINVSYEKASNGHTLALFKYGILANFTDKIVKECRGIIIDMDTMQVVCRPFDKFCNYGEAGADEIDWASAKVQEKIDGSIMKLWYYNNKWCVSTNGTIDAFKAPTLSSFRQFFFGEVFYQAIRRVRLDISKLDSNFTYIFELTSPYNRVVIDYGKEPNLWHLGTRNNITGEEVYKWIGVQQPKEYSLNSLDKCINAAKHLNDNIEGVENEGFVVVDKNWHRIKVKSPTYVAIHHILPNGEISNEKIVHNIRNGEIDEILVYVPSLQKRVDIWKTKIHNFELQFKRYIDNCKIELRQMNESYSDIEKPYIRKDFAIKHQHDWFFSFAMGILFDNKELNLNFLSDKKYYQLISKMM